MMAGNNEKLHKSLDRVSRCLESSLYPALTRVLGEAQKADAISYNHKFRQIFMNRLAEELWRNNPLCPERKYTSVRGMSFGATNRDADGSRVPRLFSWGMSRNQAATVIQVFGTFNFIAAGEGGISKIL